MIRKQNIIGIDAAIKGTSDQEMTNCSSGRCRFEKKQPPPEIIGHTEDGYEIKQGYCYVAKKNWYQRGDFGVKYFNKEKCYE